MANETSTCDYPEVEHPGFPCAHPPIRWDLQEYTHREGEPVTDPPGSLINIDGEFFTMGPQTGEFGWDLSMYDYVLVPWPNVDINVWVDEETNVVRITGYEMHRDPKTGFWETDTAQVLFSIPETDLDPELHSDNWFGFGDDATPNSLPSGVFDLIRPELYKLVAASA
jgi:hypothetical protein